ncbi:DUF6520 family protein [Flavobacterium sp. JP2137]|uniref:DUF6520 family protein n=1 Tax=Flavobacterium sp. JP2137 TaxID=3414510 RepID=UPI003D2FB6C5
MTTNLKKVIMPLAVVVFGAVAAFASNAVNKSEKAPMDAYHYDISKPAGQKCVKVRVDCQNTGTILCTDSFGNRGCAVNCVT